MADAITIKALQDASLDAKSLEEVVNGDDARQVTTRLGETYPSVKKAIKTMFDNGGLPATPFATKALMTASALVDGQYAQITDDTVNNGLYVKTAGAWVKSEYDPTGLANSYTDTSIADAKSYTDAELEFKKDIVNASVVFAFADKMGNTALSVLSDGTVSTDRQSIGSTVIKNIDSDNAVLEFEDKNGNVSWSANDDGSITAAKIDVKELTVNGAVYKAQQDNADIGGVDAPLGGNAAEINGINSYGQSLSIGSTAVPVISVTQNKGNLMFSSGVRTQDADADPAIRYASLVPLIETTNLGLGETPVSGMTDMIAKLASAKTATPVLDLGYQMLVSAAGSDGSPILNLNSGSNQYKLLKENIAQSKIKADALNKTYAYQATTWMQGEADYSSGTPKDAYKAMLSRLIDDISSDVRAITGQQFNPAFISYQTASHLRYAQSAGVESAFKADIAQGQLELSLTHSNMTIACPTYHLDYTSAAKVNQVHLTATDSRTVGAYFGIAYKRVVLDGKKWKPLVPTAIIRNKNTVYVKLNVPRPPLVIDVTWVLENTNYGFRVFNGGTQLDITSVSLLHGDTVKIVCSQQVSTGFTVDYALFTNDPVKETGREFGARGNIRDSQGEDFTADDYGIDRKLHNWLLMFTYTEGVSKWL